MQKKRMTFISSSKSTTNLNSILFNYYAHSSIKRKKLSYKAYKKAKYWQAIGHKLLGKLTHRRLLIDQYVFLIEATGYSKTNPGNNGSCIIVPSLSCTNEGFAFDRNGYRQRQRISFNTLHKAVILHLSRKQHLRMKDRNDFLNSGQNAIRIRKHRGMN